MKSQDIIKVIAVEFKTKDLVEINKILKSKETPAIRFKMTGKKLGHLGFTGILKGLTEVGIKVYDVNKVSLIKYADIETFEKAKPKVLRPPTVKETPIKKKEKEIVPNFDDRDADFLRPEKFRVKKPGKSQSAFIPTQSKKKSK